MSTRSWRSVPRNFVFVIEQFPKVAFSIFAFSWVCGTLTGLYARVLFSLFFGDR